LAQLHYTKH